MLLAGVYVPPRQGAEGRQELEGLYEQLANRIHSFMSQGCSHACIMGDFNAHLGSSNEFTHEHHALQARFPELSLPRWWWDNRVGQDGFPRNCFTTQARQPNSSGKLLLDVCTSAPFPLITTTGRGRAGDRAQPTCREATRTEHVSLTADLCASLHHVCVLSR